ncbi:MAG: rod shape-determining protein MreC [Firmicutes bacterium HGW-Firmicutes-13]|nr:MAG: rod shape-determining protein MreC [Firmicutes bacterium HGW-Firmicutes-13]
MLTPLYKKKKIMVILLLMLLLVIFMSLTERERDRLTILESVILSAVSPFQNAVFTVSARVRDYTELMTGYYLLAQENTELKKSVSSYQGMANQLEELRQENKRLRQMLDFKERSSYTLIPAKVVARDPSEWFNIMVINKGYKDGVSKDMAIITGEGLVGNVYAVSPYASKVLLLTDSRRAISGVVQNSREMGIIGFVEGSVELPGYCRMINISREANIQKGDVIVSSGLGGVFPPGFVIGCVIEVGQDEYGLLKSALIEPAVSFNRLEEVFVVKSTGYDFREEEYMNDEFTDNENLQDN